MENKKEPIKIRLSTAILSLLIILLLLVIIGMYFFYNPIDRENKNDNMISQENVLEETNKIEDFGNYEKIEEEKIKELEIDSEIVKKLYGYILKFSAYDEKLVYQNQKVTNQNLDNHLKLATIFEHLKESDATQIIKNTNNYGDETKHEIFSTEIVENKAKEIFGNNVNINHENASYQLATDIHFENGKYDRFNFQGGGGTQWESSRSVIIKAEEEGDKLYIYDKYVHLIEIENIINGIYKSGTYDIYATSDREIKLAEKIDFDEKGIYEGTENLSDEEYDRQVVKNIERVIGKELKTFKHTYQKDEKGNYYWVSTEIYN